MNLSGEIGLAYVLCAAPVFAEVHCFLRPRSDDVGSVVLSSFEPVICWDMLAALISGLSENDVWKVARVSRNGKFIVAKSVSLREPLSREDSDGDVGVSGIW